MQWLPSVKVFRVNVTNLVFAVSVVLLLESLASVSIKFIVRVKAWLCVKIVLAFTSQLALGKLLKLLWVSFLFVS